MSPSHANKKGKRCCYYVSQTLINERRGAAPLGRRLPAGELEGLVIERVLAFLQSQVAVYAAIEAVGTEANQSSDLIGRAAELAQSWSALAPSEQRQTLLGLLARIDVRRDSIEIHASISGLVSTLQGENTGSVARTPDNLARMIVWSLPMRLRRAGIEKRLIIEGQESSARRKPDNSMCRLIAQAHRYKAMLLNCGDKTMTDLANEAQVTGSYFTRILRLSFLAPDVLKAILLNRHPVELSAKRLTNDICLPVAWDAQCALLDIG